jgi:hypothetical protein
MSLTQLPLGDVLERGHLAVVRLSVVTLTSATPDMDEQQKTAAEQPTTLPAVQIFWGSKKAT